MLLGGRQSKPRQRVACFERLSFWCLEFWSWFGGACGVEEREGEACEKVGRESWIRYAFCRGRYKAMIQWRVDLAGALRPLVCDAGFGASGQLIILSTSGCFAKSYHKANETHLSITIVFLA